MISQILIVLSDTEETLNSDSDEENKLLYLTKIGYLEVEASIAMERCGSDSSIAELTDFIYADQMAKATDALLMKKQRKLEKKLLNEDDHAVHLSIPMIGSGVPTEPDQITQRTLPEDAIGSPYFYYEQIHLSNPMMVSLKTIHKDLYRDMFHGGINVLSLFSGINDAEVAFYCLGILLKTDEQELNDNQLEQLMSRFNGLDLVVGGIKRNNLTGRNKHHQDELEDFFVGAFSCNDCYDNSLFSCFNISHSFRIMEQFS
ncbi:DNA (Cytosine-5)-methyltransferase DRM1/2 isoform 4 [Hibiscus syriacus]|uniref:DNA (Cytosine-5)-methyltransferase DRM1/2 isoform 4 n=1 Tax=Hibiscus syriacus TaxID=106335 RepID=A0A6A2XRN9_HIBSY|nr:DNA (Cytosine-5)-methyltransferase DRM1/2 isoform 4 [Hibiscus syriacus]